MREVALRLSNQKEPYQTTFFLLRLSGFPSFQVLLQLLAPSLAGTLAFPATPRLMDTGHRTEEKLLESCQCLDDDNDCFLTLSQSGSNHQIDEISATASNKPSSNNVCQLCPVQAAWPRQDVEVIFNRPITSTQASHWLRRLQSWLVIGGCQHESRHWHAPELGNVSWDCSNITSDDKMKYFSE